MASNSSKKKQSSGSGKAASSKATAKTSAKADTKKNSTAGSRSRKQVPAVSAKKEEYVQETLQDYTNPMLMKEAVMWVILAVCILLFISYFGIGGYLGEVIADLSFGIFGLAAYLFPVLVFIAAAFWISNRGNRIAAVKFTSAIVLYLCLCSFMGLFTGQYDEITTLGGLYEDSAAYHWGGGILGGGICHFLCPALGAVGTAIVLLVISIICVVLITQKSLMKSMKRQSTKVYQNARESSVRRREAHQQERQRQEEWRRFEQESDPLKQRPEEAYAQESVRRREPVKVERVAADVKRRKRGAQIYGETNHAADTYTERAAQNISVLLEDTQPEVRPARSGRTEIEVPVIFPANRRENRMDRRVTGVSMNTKLEGNPAAASADAHEIRPARTAAPVNEYESRQKNQKADETCYIDLGEENSQTLANEDSVQILTEKSPAPQEEKVLNFRIEGIESEEQETEELPSGVSYDELLTLAHEDMEQAAVPVREQKPEVAEAADEDEEFWDEMPESEAEELPEAAAEMAPKKKRSFDGDIFRSSNSAAPSTSGTVFRAEPKKTVRTEAADEDAPDAAPAKDGEVPSKRNPRSSEKEIAEGIASVEAEMAKAAEAVKPEYVYPPIDLLKKGKGKNNSGQENEIRQTAARLQKTLESFGVNVTIQNVSCGPSVTRYEILPEMGVKVSKIVSLADDIKMNLAAADIRIEAPIPGKMAVGIEVPNKETGAVAFRDLVESDEFQNHSSKIAFATGKDIAGKVVVSDIAKMPHLLIAGATGSGKSVCINTLIMSILYKAHPDEVKLIMIDPKVVELSVYNGIPHLFIPVVTDPKKAAGALNWAVAEMTDRYNKFAEYGVRDLKGYNKKVEALDDIDDPNKPKKLPQIVIIVDELADLMMVAPGEVEDAICRLAQLARACGIHLIIATQRPSVNVITGLIKANMPSRIAFSVSSGVDSRTILDMNGAEKLLGKGDMLFAPQGYPKPARVQGAFVSDEEVADVVDFLKNKNMDPSYNTDMEAQIAKVQQAGVAARGAEDRDALFADAGKFIIDKDKGSIGMLQRVFKIGFNRAARIMDQLADAGVVSEEAGTKPRQILMSMEQFENYLEEN